MWLFKFIVTIFFVIIIFWLSLFNRDAVEFSLYPFIESVSFPKALIILGSVLTGFIWGALIVWLNGGQTRSEMRQLRREVKSFDAAKTKLKQDIVL